MMGVCWASAESPGGCWLVLCPQTSGLHPGLPSAAGCSRQVGEELVFSLELSPLLPSRSPKERVATVMVWPGRSSVLVLLSARHLSPGLLFPLGPKARICHLICPCLNPKWETDSNLFPQGVGLASFPIVCVSSQMTSRGQCRQPPASSCVVQAQILNTPAPRVEGTEPSTKCSFHRTTRVTPAATAAIVTIFLLSPPWQLPVLFASDPGIARSWDTLALSVWRHCLACGIFCFFVVVVCCFKLQFLFLVYPICTFSFTFLERTNVFLFCFVITSASQQPPTPAPPNSG